MSKTEKKPRIIVFDEDANSLEMTDGTVCRSLKAKSTDIVEDAVDTMSTDMEPEESALIVNPDLNLTFANMTDAQARSLSEKSGILSIEEDEIVHAHGSFEGDLYDLDQDFFFSDPEARAEIEEWNEALLDQSDAALNSMIPSNSELFTGDEEENSVDDDGELLSLIDENPLENIDGKKVDKKKLVKIILCVLKCAAKHAGSNVNEVALEDLLESADEEGLDLSADALVGVRDYITCGLRICYVPSAWRHSSGSGAKVAVIDTGISSRHIDLRVYGGVSFVPSVSSWRDDNGHGTHVAGTIAARANRRGLVGVAPHARLYAVKVLNSRGQGRSSDILNGLSWCVRNRMHVANLSLGSGASSHSPSDYRRSYERAGRLMRRRGVLPVASAGNNGRTSSPYVGNPGRCPSFMAVASVNCKRKRSSFSSYGPQVEISAPGSDVLSTVLSGEYGKKSGTSMAAPHVSGLAALIKSQHPTWGPDRIRNKMRSTARNLGHPWLYGSGLMHAHRAMH